MSPVPSKTYLVLRQGDLSLLVTQHQLCVFSSDVVVFSGCFNLLWQITEGKMANTERKHRELLKHEIISWKHTISSYETKQVNHVLKTLFTQVSFHTRQPPLCHFSLHSSCSPSMQTVMNDYWFGLVKHI